MNEEPTEPSAVVRPSPSYGYDRSAGIRLPFTMGVRLATTKSLSLNSAGCTMGIRLATSHPRISTCCRTVEVPRPSQFIGPFQTAVLLRCSAATRRNEDEFRWVRIHCRTTTQTRASSETSYPHPFRPGSSPRVLPDYWDLALGRAIHYQYNHNRSLPGHQL